MDSTTVSFNLLDRDRAPWNCHYRTLDYWRGIAALWVMIFHGFGEPQKGIPPHALSEAIRYVAQFGWLGVPIFFVISGYCIAASVYRAHTKGQISPNQFLLDRATRIFPVYWGAFLFTIVLNLIASPFSSIPFWQSFPKSWQSWIGNILLIQPYINVPYYGIVYWSLVVEVGFYLIVALLLFLAQRYGYKVALLSCLLLSCISFFFPSDFAVQSVVLWKDFFCGILVFTALLGRHNSNVWLRNTSLFALGLFLALGLLSIQPIWDQHVLNAGSLWFTSLFAITLYFIYPIDRQLSCVANLQWLQFSGKISYSLYLLHVPLIIKVVNLSRRLVPPDGLLILLTQILACAVALASGYLFHLKVEKPLNDWRHHRKLNKRRTCSIK